MSEDEMRDHLQVDSLKFITLDGLYRAVGEAKGRDSKCPQYCDACFSGEYPTALTDHDDRDNISNLSLLSEANG
jgi:amidophosphoribosyltransferase